MIIIVILTPAPVEFSGWRYIYRCGWRPWDWWAGSPSQAKSCRSVLLLPPLVAFTVATAAGVSSVSKAGGSQPRWRRLTKGQALPYYSTYMYTYIYLIIRLHTRSLCGQSKYHIIFLLTNRGSCDVIELLRRYNRSYGDVRENFVVLSCVLRVVNVCRRRVAGVLQGGPPSEAGWGSGRSMPTPTELTSWGSLIWTIRLVSFLLKRSAGLTV